MNILVVNDDGFQSPGFAALVKTLSEKADVFVCAPDGQRSAKSHSITLGQHITAEKIDFPGAKLAYKSSGSPADCTKMGLQFCKEAGVEIDMVFSGINMGSNLGRDTLYSGTIGAAAEGALSGVHSVAVSVSEHDSVYFDTAAKLAADVTDLVFEKMDKSIVLNINVPNLPREEIKGIKFAALGNNRYYDDKFHPVGGSEYALSGKPSEVHGWNPESDMAAVRDGYAVITPLQFDFTSYRELEKIKGWKLSL